MMASISAAILSFFAITGNCAVYEAIVPLEGSQEVPPIAVNTSGTARLRFEGIDGQLVWEIEHNLGDRVTAAHFHGPADRGENAAIQINIGDFSNSYTSPIVGETFLNANQSFELFNGRWYINLHTTDYPGGEIRGQVAVTMNVLETWQEEFEYHKVLYPKSTDGHVEVFWSVFDDQWIEVAVAARTVGWVGFGVTKTPTMMEESDIVMGWVADDGEYVLQNRYREKGSGNGTPRLFEDQTYIRAIDGFKETVNGSTMTYMRFEKAIGGVRGNEYAVPIKEGTMNVLWGIGDTALAANDTPRNHGNCETCRGLDTMNFNVIYSDGQAAIEWYMWIVGIIVLILVFIIGMLCGYFFFQKQCLKKVRYASLGDKEASIQKKVLLDSQAGGSVRSATPKQ